MILDFAGSSGLQYSLTCINQSTTSWYFYIYQRVPNQSDSGVYSLVWMASPYKLGPQSYVTFTWSIDYSFVWLDTGVLQTGVVPYSAGNTPASLPVANGATFDIIDDAPQLSEPVQGSYPNGFSIAQGSHIANSVFSTGIGMSGFAILVQQSYMNTVQIFGIATTYWVAASIQRVQPTQILSQAAISNSSAFAFPANKFSLKATLGETNAWTIR